MINVGILARVEICAAVRLVGHGISIEIIPLIPDGSISAACSGKKPDSECPIRMAPRNCFANAAMLAHVGFGIARVELRSGIICLYSSSTAAMGNCPSSNGTLNVGPNRKTDHAV